MKWSRKRVPAASSIRPWRSQAHSSAIETTTKPMKAVHHWICVTTQLTPCGTLFSLRRKQWRRHPNATVNNTRQERLPGRSTKIIWWYRHYQASVNSRSRPIPRKLRRKERCLRKRSSLVQRSYFSASSHRQPRQSSKEISAIGRTATISKPPNSACWARRRWTFRRIHHRYRWSISRSLRARSLNSLQPRTRINSLSYRRLTRHLWLVLVSLRVR